MKHFKRFLGALALASLLSLSVDADAQSSNWLYWCEWMPGAEKPVCGWVWFGTDRRKGKGSNGKRPPLDRPLKKGGKK